MGSTEFAVSALADSVKCVVMAPEGIEAHTNWPEA
jgi:hypothetical protein